MVIPSVQECRHSARKEPTRRLGLGLSGEGASRAASSTNPSQFYKQHGWETEQWENHCEPGSSREPPQHTNPQISTCLMKTNRPESSMSFGNECLMSNFSSSKNIDWKASKKYPLLPPASWQNCGFLSHRLHFHFHCHRTWSPDGSKEYSLKFILLDFSAGLDIADQQILLPHFREINGSGLTLFYFFLHTKYMGIIMSSCPYVFIMYHLRLAIQASQLSIIIHYLYKSLGTQIS